VYLRTNLNDRARTGNNKEPRASARTAVPDQACRRIAQRHLGIRAAGVVSVLLPALAAHAADMKMTVTDLPAAGLVSFKPDRPLNTKAAFTLRDDAQSIPAQLDSDGRLWWHQPKACTDAGCTYSLVSGSAREAGTGGVKVEPGKDGLINVTIDGKPFTVFNYGKDLPKPFLYPVIGPTGTAVTRHYPMKEVASEPQKRRDHPHHRSLWTAHGDVRVGNFDKKGTDYWAQGRNTGIQKVARIVRTAGGPVFGLIEADIDWVTASGKKELSETRTYRFYKDGDDQRIIDVKVVFKFTEGDVMFADTKEGGILSLRVAVSMDEVTGGKMVNSKGDTGMGKCWGQPAEWCDYVGSVDGQTLGIAVFDARTNPFHPTRWHIRDYGLYTANPFMAGAVAGEQKKKDPSVKVADGSHTWKKGQSAVFNYRILIHKGDTSAANVAEQYRLYTEPAKVTLK